MSIQIRVVGLVASAIFAGAASAQTAVEWKVGEGGNGHWYAISVDGRLWTDARERAIELGGHLATATSQAELDFFKPLMTADGGQRDYFMGSRRDSVASPFYWITGEPMGFALWWDVGSDPERLYMEVIGRPTAPGYGRMNSERIYAGGGGQHFIIEWDADCNADGIVDYGQIKSGQLADDNTNGIPDICETSITGVLPPSVPAQGGSTITINGRNFPAQPSVLVGGVAATNVVRVSDSRLTAVTPPLLPGIAPLTVNGFTLPDAIYIRPECGSDLDQNGSVDAGDISIILLDFGPCYEPPAALAAPAPTPLLADEPAQKPTQR